MNVRDELKLEAKAAQSRADLKERAAAVAKLDFLPIPGPLESSGAEYGRIIAFNHGLDRVRMFASGVEVSDKVHGGYLTAEAIEADLRMLGG